MFDIKKTFLKYASLKFWKIKVDNGMSTLLYLVLSSSCAASKTSTMSNILQNLNSNSCKSWKALSLSGYSHYIQQQYVQYAPANHTYIKLQDLQVWNCFEVHFLCENVNFWLRSIWNHFKVVPLEIAKASIEDILYAANIFTASDRKSWYYLLTRLVFNGSLKCFSPLNILHITSPCSTL